MNEGKMGGMWRSPIYPIWKDNVAGERRYTAFWRAFHLRLSKLAFCGNVGGPVRLGWWLNFQRLRPPACCVNNRISRYFVFPRYILKSRQNCYTNGEIINKRRKIVSFSEDKLENDFPSFTSWLQTFSVQQLTPWEHALITVIRAWPMFNIQTSLEAQVHDTAKSKMIWRFYLLKLAFVERWET